MMFDKNNTNYSGEDLCSSCRFRKVFDLCSSCRFRKVFDFEYGTMQVCMKTISEVKNVGVCCEYQEGGAK